MESALPLPNGPLSMQVPASGIAAANKAVKAILPAPEATSETGKQEWGPYDHFTAKEKAHIGKRTAEYGVSANCTKVFRAYLLKQAMC